MMLDIFTTLNSWEWFGLAALLLIIELVIANTGFLLWIAIAAVVTGVVLWFIPDMMWYYQYVIFVVILLFCAVAGKKYLRRRAASQTGKILLNRRAEQYVGREFFLEEAIINGRGRIQVDDSFWRVAGPDLPAGTQVRVTCADGVILQVVACEPSVRSQK
jgi:membrane protein implicated in regulation of membrane protease activity